VTLEIDEKVFNPSRISKVYGTLARKGDHTNDRPHRWARIILAPDHPQAVPVELLQAIAVSPRQANNRGQQQSQDSKFDLAAYLQKYGVPVKAVKDHRGSTLHVLEHCLFDESHRGGEAAIGQTPEGKLFYQCFHDSCKGRTWHDARSKISGTDRLTEPAAQEKRNGGQPALEETDFGETAKLFPCIPFPWDILPSGVSESLQRLARACASSASSLPDAAFCNLASVLGRSLCVSPKEGWREPLIFWHADVRPSGAGKTPAARELANALHQAQAKEHSRWKSEADDYRKLPKKDRDRAPEPAKSRGYFLSDLTLEGLRDDLENHPTGGLVVIQDELSAFIGGQNQYKQRGTDRESWLALWDGKPARIVRKDRSVYLVGARVSVFGGIQPGVFKRVFSDGDGGLYLVDGTIFRFLLTCEGHRFYELTPESWDTGSRNVTRDWIV
jgi:hypothetical protein